MWLADIRIIPIMVTAAHGIGIHGDIMIHGGDGAVRPGRGAGVRRLSGVHHGGGAHLGHGARHGDGGPRGVFHHARTTRRRGHMRLTAHTPAQAPTAAILTETEPDRPQPSVIHLGVVRQVHKALTAMV